MATLDPRHGGSVEAGRLFTTGLLRDGHIVEAVCLDRPGQNWHEAWSCPVHYLGPSYTPYLYCPALVPWLKANAARFDALLVHNIYRYISLGAWRMAQTEDTPYFLFTHGMLDPWFKHNHPIKHAKKAAYWRLIGARMFRQARAVLYTCEDERLLAHRSFSPYECNERVAALGIADPLSEPFTDPYLFRERFVQLENRPYLLYLGRISPKKGVDLLIEAFADVYAADEVSLVIAGGDENGLQGRLAEMPSAKTLGGRLLWTGHLDRDLKWSAISGAEAMCLFSHSENFAISVSEALALSVPVLLTNKVNIWQEVAQDEAGLAQSDDLEGATRLLSTWRQMDADARTRMRSKARETFRTRFEIGNTVRTLVAAINETALEAAGTR